MDKGIIIFLNCLLTVATFVVHLILCFIFVSQSFPSKFVERLPVKAKVRLANDAGLYWDVTWSRTSKGFVGGWSTFAHAHDLQESDVLALEILNPYLMKYNIYEESGIEKNFLQVETYKRQKIEEDFWIT